jgi:hypothetical protein
MTVKKWAVLGCGQLQWPEPNHWRSSRAHQLPILNDGGRGLQFNCKIMPRKLVKKSKEQSPI